MSSIEQADLTDIATYGYRNERWNFVEGEAQVGIINKLNKEQNRYVINAQTSRVVWRTLTFYTGATLVRVVDYSWSPHGLAMYFFGLRGQYRRMDGSRHLLSFLNEQIPLKLTAQNVPEYLKFFCFFVRYHGRPFILVEHPDDIGYCEPPLTPAQSAALSPHLHPITLLADRGDAGYLLKATVRYSDMLFDAEFEVLPNGQVQMLQDSVTGTFIPVPNGVDAAPAWAA